LFPLFFGVIDLRKGVFRIFCEDMLSGWSVQTCTAHENSRFREKPKSRGRREREREERGNVVYIIIALIVCMLLNLHAAQLSRDHVFRSTSLQATGIQLRLQMVAPKEMLVADILATCDAAAAIVCVSTAVSSAQRKSTQLFGRSTREGKWRAVLRWQGAKVISNMYEAF
jgi:hypothetical protein